MDTDTLKEMFDPHMEAQNMTLEQVVAGVHEMRASEPDDTDMTDEEIARILQS